MFFQTLSQEELIKEKNFEDIPALILSKLPALIGAAVIIVAGVVIAKLICALAVKAMAAKGIDSSVHGFIRTMIFFVIMVVFVLSALSTLGVNINSFVAAIGAAGITAGLGFQNVISQFASGLTLLVNKQFKSGDFVEIGSTSGKVHEIKMMHTVLITIDNKRVIIPNSTVTSSNITNYSTENFRRIDLVYSVSYDTDIAKAKSVLSRIVEGSDLVCKDPAPIIAVKEHAASSINIACYIWCDNANYWTVYYYMQEAVKLAFDREGISIPFNQIDVHIKEQKND